MTSNQHCSGVYASLVRENGESATFMPAGGPAETVRVVKSDPVDSGGLAVPVQMILGGTMADSGFSQRPAKSDKFRIDDTFFRVFDVKCDQTGWLDLYLTR